MNKYNIHIEYEDLTTWSQPMKAADPAVLMAHLYEDGTIDDASTIVITKLKNVNNGEESSEQCNQ